MQDERSGDKENHCKMIVYTDHGNMNDSAKQKGDVARQCLSEVDGGGV